MNLQNNNFLEVIEMKKDEVLKSARVVLTFSCPLPVYVWLKENQKNLSAYVVQAVEDAIKRDGQTVE